MMHAPQTMIDEWNKLAAQCMAAAMDSTEAMFKALTDSAGMFTALADAATPNGDEPADDLPYLGRWRWWTAPNGRLALVVDEIKPGTDVGIAKRVADEMGAAVVIRIEGSIDIEDALLSEPAEKRLIGPGESARPDAEHLLGELLRMAQQENAHAQNQGLHESFTVDKSDGA